MKKFDRKSISVSGKCSVIEQFLRSLPVSKGKWLKLETCFKVKQRSNELLIDGLTVRKINE